MRVEGRAPALMRVAVALDEVAAGGDLDGERRGRPRRCRRTASSQASRKACSAPSAASAGRQRLQRRDRIEQQEAADRRRPTTRPFAAKRSTRRRAQAVPQQPAPERAGSVSAISCEPRMHELGDLEDLRPAPAAPPRARARSATAGSSARRPGSCPRRPCRARAAARSRRGGGRRRRRARAQRQARGGRGRACA